MNNTTVFNAIRWMIAALATSCFLGKHETLEKIKEASEKNKELLRFVDKGLYGYLKVKIIHSNSLDKIELQNANCDQFNKHIALNVIFDFSKEIPTLNYGYVDTTLQIPYNSGINFEFL